MRTIKFRAWNKEQKVWHTGGDLCISMDGQLLGWQVGDDPHLWAIQRFTGLLDKNGREVYEGDIFRRPKLKKNQRRDRFDSKVFKVYYEEGFGSFQADEIVEGEGAGDLYDLAKDRTWTTGERLQIDTFEVIGNIYENPELLEQKQT